MCLARDVSFSRIPAKGWQAQKGRGQHHSLSLSALRGIPHQTPVLGVTQIPQLVPGSSRARCFFFFIFFHPVSSSLHLKSCSAIKLKKCSKDLCQNVCPSQWHMPNCQLTGGHTTWGTVNFPQQMEVCWSRRRPTTGLLEQMLCRQSLDLCFPHPPLAPSSLTAFVDVSRALQHDRYPNLKFLYYPSCLSNHLQPFRS